MNLKNNTADYTNKYIGGKVPIDIFPGKDSPTNTNRILGFGKPKININLDDLIYLRHEIDHVYQGKDITPNSRKSLENNEELLIEESIVALADVITWAQTAIDYAKDKKLLPQAQRIIGRTIINFPSGFSVPLDYLVKFVNIVGLGTKTTITPALVQHIKYLERMIYGKNRDNSIPYEIQNAMQGNPKELISKYKEQYRPILTNEYEKLGNEFPIEKIKSIINNKLNSMKHEDFVKLLKITNDPFYYRYIDRNGDFSVYERSKPMINPGYKFPNYRK